jgi:protein-S-isoprenylcysteine O-methyltransferase Ste14
MDFLPITGISILFLLQIIIGFYVLPAVIQHQMLAYTGIGLYIFSGWIFGFLPIIEFRRKGNVKLGKSYVHTTKLVDTGLYAIVRHPQFTTCMIWAVAGILVFQHWIVILIGIPIIPLTFIDLKRADKRLLNKFGTQYEHYMKTVPRANFILGIYQYIKRKKEGNL